MVEKRHLRGEADTLFEFRNCGLLIQGMVTHESQKHMLNKYPGFQRVGRSHETERRKGVPNRKQAPE